MIRDMGINEVVICCLASLLLTVCVASPAKEISENLDDPRLSVQDEILEPLSQKRFDSFTNGFGQSKRSFDEISRSSFGFNKRKNYDDIGRIPFAYVNSDNQYVLDRPGFAKRDFDEIGRSSFGFNKRLNKQDAANPALYNQKRDFDEIDRSSFGFTKRGEFDEIGRSSFGFYRRSPQTRPSNQWRFFAGFGKRSPGDKRNFDEISRTSFGFNRRSDLGPK